MWNKILFIVCWVPWLSEDDSTTSRVAAAFFQFESNQISETIKVDCQ